jgi:hypothetical protein
LTRRPSNSKNKINLKTNKKKYSVIFKSLEQPVLGLKNGTRDKIPIVEHNHCNTLCKKKKKRFLKIYLKFENIDNPTDDGKVKV